MPDTAVGRHDDAILAAEADGNESTELNLTGPAKLAPAA